MKRKFPAISVSVKERLNTNTFKWFQDSFDFNLSDRSATPKEQDDGLSSCWNTTAWL